MPAIPMKTPDHLGVPESDLLAGGALWTAREIEQQPAMLERTHALLAGLQAQIDAFAGPVAQDLGGQGGQEPRGDRVELADVTERERAQE